MLVMQAVNLFGFIFLLKTCAQFKYLCSPGASRQTGFTTLLLLLLRMRMSIGNGTSIQVGSFTHFLLPIHSALVVCT